MELIKRLRTEPLDWCATRIDLMDLCREAADKLENNESEFASLLKIIGTQACLTQKVEALALELDTVKAARDAAIAGQETLQKALASACKERDELKKELHEAKSELDAMRNELCYKCWNYEQAHNGWCDHCRWKKEA